jgi:type VI secretion system protein ImpC
MATRSSAGSVSISVVSEMEESRPVAEPGTPFRIGLLGDFSGRGNRKLTDSSGTLRDQRVYAIDRDNLSEVLSKLQVELHIPILGKESPSITLRVTNMDDFHPDRLFENVEIFDALKETRESVKDPAVVSAIANQLDPAANRSEPSATTKETEPPGNLLEQILDATQEQSSSSRSQPPSDLEEFVKQIVKPHLVAKTDPLQAQLIAKVDSAIGELMRKILHHSDFQAIEAAWRGLHFLVSQLETDENLKLFLIDVSKEELSDDLSAADDISTTGIYKLLVKPTAETGDEEPWAVLAGNFTFDRTPEDAALLSRLANLAKAAGAPFIAAAHPHLLGCDSLAQTPDPDDWRLPDENSTRDAWAALRRLPETSFVGLALPRFLLRLPYSKETEPVDCLDFEEMEASPRHKEYLWGNPCYACVYLIAQAFSQYGWNFHPGIIQEIGGLPLHFYKEQGESRVKPCAETVLTQRAAEAILDHGIMPLLSFLNQDNVRLARFQSFADPPSPLLGRWR